MRRVGLIAVTCALLLASAIAIHLRSASGQQAPALYNPYPPGILPSDLDSEIARVQREVQGIENEAIAEWQALPPPDLTGNPPILKDSGYQANEVLGKLLDFDLNISPFKNVACASCHMPYGGFSGPIPSDNLTMVAYAGTYHYRAAKRVAQRYTYSPFFPVLEYNTTQAAFFGGNFWDGRATGYLLQNPDAHQAQGPPVDPLEMVSPTRLALRGDCRRPYTSRYS
jgi:cytochrome c peroxidase